MNPNQNPNPHHNPNQNPNPNPNPNPNQVLQLYENALAKQQGGKPVGAPAQRDVDDDGSAIFWHAASA